MGRKIDLTGRKFGHLTVIKEAGKSNLGSIMWLCKCDCGKEKVINGNNLRQGKSQSCGCSSRGNLIQYNRKVLKNKKFKDGYISNYITKKGVCRYVARCRVSNKTIYVGTFNTESEAEKEILKFLQKK